MTWTKVETGGAAPAAQRSSMRQRQWNTLEKLRGMRAVLLCLDLLLLLCVFAALQAQRSTLRRMDTHELPAFLAVQRLRFALEAMQDDTAGGAPARTPSGGGPSSAYEVHRAEASRALLETTQTSLDPSSSAGLLQTLALGLGTFERFAGGSLDTGMSTSVEGRARSSNTQIESLTNGQLMPAMQALDDLTTRQVKTSLLEQHVESSSVRLGLFLLGALAVLFALVLTQTFLSQRTRRTFNLPLLAATALVLLAGSRYLLTEDAVRHGIAAQENLFASVRDLWRLRETAYLVDLSESRAFVEAARSQEQLRIRDGAAETMMSPVPRLTEQELQNALRSTGQVSGFTGLLADELGRRQQQRNLLVDALGEWQAYLKHLGDTRMGVTASSSLEKGDKQRLRRLEEFDHSLELALRIDEADLQDSLANSAARERGLQMQALGAAALFAFLIVSGLSPRIREYR